MKSSASKQSTTPPGARSGRPGRAPEPGGTRPGEARGGEAATQGGIRNAFEGTDLAAIFIDAQCRIRNFTPRAGTLFHIRDTDIGSPLTELPPFAGDTELRGDVSQALRHSHTIEKTRSVTGGSRSYATTILPCPGNGQRSSAAVVTFVDVTPLRRAREQVARYSSQQKAIADFAHRAMLERDLHTVMDAAAHLIAESLGVDCVKVLELLPEGEGLLLRAGTGWGEGSVGREIIRTGDESQAGFALATQDLVTVSDLSRETRFSDRPLLHEHKVLSGISCIIRDHEGKPCGVLGAHARSRRRYSDEDTRFLQAMAAILAYAIYRDRVETELQSLTTSFEAQVRRRTRALEEHRHLVRHLSSELIVNEQRERRQIARDLHDHLAQLLVVGKMKLGQLDREALSSADAELVREAAACLDQALTYTRDLIPEISPTLLYDFGLLKAIHWLAGKMQAYGLEVEVRTRLRGSSLEFSEPAAIILFQVIRELLFKVLKHAEVEGVRLHIGRAAPGRVRFRLSDCGATLGETGKLGLLNVLERIESLGGRLDITAEPNRGTCIAFTVPTGARHQRAAGGAATGAGDLASRPDPTRSSGTATRVLVADDQSLFRDEARALLEATDDIEVVGEAADGVEAIELCRRLQPDLVLMDINMPELDGIEATRAIKAQQPAVRIIGLSMQSEDLVREAFAEAGGDHYLSKSEPFETVLEAIRGHAAR